MRICRSRQGWSTRGVDRVVLSKGSSGPLGIAVNGRTRGRGLHAPVDYLTEMVDDGTLAEMPPPPSRLSAMTRWRGLAVGDSPGRRR